MLRRHPASKPRRRERRRKRGLAWMQVDCWGSTASRAAEVAIMGLSATWCPKLAPHSSVATAANAKAIARCRPFRPLSARS